MTASGMEGLREKPEPEGNPDVLELAQIFYSLDQSECGTANVTTPLLENAPYQIKWAYILKAKQVYRLWKPAPLTTRPPFTAGAKLREAIAAELYDQSWHVDGVPIRDSITYPVFAKAPESDRGIFLRDADRMLKAIRTLLLPPAPAGESCGECGKAIVESTDDPRYCNPCLNKVRHI